MIVPDINLLLYAYDAAFPEHEKAVSWWQDCLSGAETIGLHPLVVFGFPRIATNVRVFQRPMTPKEAGGHIRLWFNRPMVELLEQDANDVERTLQLLEQQGTAGNLVTDAQIAAAVLKHDATLHTADSDFLRFPNLRWYNPITRVSGPKR